MVSIEADASFVPSYARVPLNVTASGFTVNELVTGVAALKSELPAWVALMETVPAPVMVTLAPAHTGRPGNNRKTSRASPEEAVAVIP